MKQGGVHEYGVRRDQKEVGKRKTGTISVEDGVDEDD